MGARSQHNLLETGSRAPEFRLPLLAGGEAALNELTLNGQILLAFFKVTCPVCQMTFPFLDRLHAAGTLPVWGISQNDPADTCEFNEEFGVTFPTLLDSEENGFAVSNAFGISSVPTMFLIERDGTVSRVIEGWRKKEMEWLGARTGGSLFRHEDNVPEWKAG
jgi:peroxiredoxin